MMTIFGMNFKVYKMLFRISANNNNSEEIFIFFYKFFFSKELGKHFSDEGKKKRKYVQLVYVYLKY